MGEDGAYFQRPRSLDRTAGPGQRGGVRGGEGSTGRADSIGRGALAPGSDLRSLVTSTSPWAPRLSCFGFSGEVSQGRGPPKKPEQVPSSLKAGRPHAPPASGSTGPDAAGALGAGRRTQNSTPEGQWVKKACVGPGAAPGSPSPKPRPPLSCLCPKAPAVFTFSRVAVPPEQGPWGWGASKDTGRSAHLSSKEHD